MNIKWIDKGIDGYGYKHQASVIDKDYSLELVQDELSLVDSFTGDSIIIDTGLKGIRNQKTWIKNNQAEIDSLVLQANNDPLYTLSIQ